MTKQEVIEKAYGEHYEKFKDLTDSNGWVLDSEYWFRDAEDFFSVEIEEENWGYGNYEVVRWRPSEIDELLYNNGWIKIESEKDLPATLGKYKVVIKDRDYGMDWWIFETYCPEDDNSKWLSRYSHYKELQNEKPPLY